MMRMFLLACVVGINALAAASLEVRVLSEGQLAIPGGEISLDAFSAGWKGARIRTEYSTDNTVERHLSDDVIHKFKILYHSENRFSTKFPLLSLILCLRIKIRATGVAPVPPFRIPIPS